METQPKSFKGRIAFGTFIGVLIQLGGYFLIHGDGRELGWSLFIVIPTVSGFAIGVAVRNPLYVLAVCGCSGLITFSILILENLEQMICLLMVLPLLAVAVFIGATAGLLFGHYILDKILKKGRANIALLIICPALISAADRVEEPFRTIQQRERFTSELTIESSTERAWDSLEEMAVLGGPRPLLMRLGLPVPTRCELDLAAVGGRRVCYFDCGSITQEITLWERPTLMSLRVTKSTLPGRNWLTFIDASYELSGNGAKTKVVRHTTIGTHLYPRWYWRPLERLGVSCEHEFVLSNLQRVALSQ